MRYFILLSVFFLGISFFTKAYELEVGIPGRFEPGQEITLAEYLPAVFYFAVGIVGVVAFGALVWGGILWITSAASADMKAKAKEQISAALMGLGLVLVSVLLLQTINPNLKDISLPELAMPAPPPPPGTAQVACASILIQDECAAEGPRCAWSTTAAGLDYCKTMLAAGAEYGCPSTPVNPSSGYDTWSGDKTNLGACNAFCQPSSGNNCIVKWY